MVREAPVHVLILDDDAGILSLERRGLERAGYVVTAAATTEEARAAVREPGRRPDVLVLDYRLGGAVTGLDVFREMRAAGIDVPALLATGFSDEKVVIEALRAGVRDVVPKAEDFLDYLPEAVRRVLEQETARKKAAEAETLHESERFYRLLAEGLPQLVWTCAADGRLDYLSRQWVEYTGASESEQLGDGWLRRVHPEDVERVRQAWQAAVKGGGPYEVEFRLQRADGVYRWFKCRGVPLRGRDGDVAKWFGTCTDIDDEKQALGLEREARRAAEEASSAKDRFLAMLSHELRTPLTPVLAMVSMLQDNGGLPPEVREELQVIRRNVELEARLIDDLLDLTRVTKGKLQLNMEAVDAHGAVRNVFEICCSEIQGKRQHVEFRLDARRHHVRADAARLQQMFWNLLKNASKFTPEEGRITVRTTDTPEGRLRVEVTDTGIGIEPDRLEALFKPFEQGGRDVTRQYGGLGLGLAITKALAEVHGGRVSAHSEGRGRGATFVIELPVVEPGRVPAPRDRGTGPDGAKTRGLRILLVEDHADTARVMARLLRGLGHDVEVAGTVIDAYEVGLRDHFDVIVSDVGLPDGTGLDLLRRLREKRVPTPAIALTGFGMEEDLERSAAAGFAAHLTKPVDVRKLGDAIVAAAGDRG